MRKSNCPNFREKKCQRGTIPSSPVNAPMYFGIKLRRFPKTDIIMVWNEELKMRVVIKKNKKITIVYFF